MRRVKRFSIVCVLVLVALACGAAVAAAAKLTAPSKASVGDSVTAHASGLKSGSYALTLVSDSQPAQGAYCVKRLTGRHATSGGKVTLTGTIPARVTCYQGNGAKLGSEKVAPGGYHLIVSVPNGPTGSNGKFSFVRRALKIVAAPKLSTPATAQVGDSVTARGSGLRKARYALTLSLDDTAGPRTACVARIGAQKNSVGGRVTISGRIPSHLRCWENNSVRLGRVAVKPGKYHLILAHPDGPSGFGKGSFVRRKLTIKG
jgi:uncharacterized protein (DUF2141 family)